MKHIKNTKEFKDSKINENLDNSIKGGFLLLEHDSFKADDSKIDAKLIHYNNEQDLLKDYPNAKDLSYDASFRDFNSDFYVDLTQTYGFVLNYEQRYMISRLWSKTNKYLGEFKNIDNNEIYALYIKDKEDKHICLSINKLWQRTYDSIKEYDAKIILDSKIKIECK